LLDSIFEAAFMPQGAEFAGLGSTSATNRSVAVWLFAGLLLCYLAVWKGDGGYQDLREYLDNAERMWLRGDLSEPPAPGEAPDAPKRYNRFSLGLPFLSGPFVYAGALLERVSSGAIGTRAVAAFAVPVYGALACVVLLALGASAGLSARTSLWAAIVFGLGSPFLSYARLYYAEVGLAFCLFLGLWAHVRGRQTAERAGIGWALLSGAGLSGAFACHYTSVILVACVWLGLATTLLLEKNLPVAKRLAQLAAFSAGPFMVGVSLLCINYAHYGSPFHTGYDPYHGPESDKLFLLRNIPGHLPLWFEWIARVPWALPALAIWISRPSNAADSGGLTKHALRAGVLAAFCLQLIFWLEFYHFHTFWLRYLSPLAALAAPGLLFVGETLARRWSARGLAYAAVLLLAWNLFGFVRGDDGSLSFFIAPDGKLYAYVWYMQPFETGKAEGFGTPAGHMQAAIFVIFAGAGIAALVLAIRRAQQNDAHNA
jgi:hypothetical protein